MGATSAQDAVIAVIVIAAVIAMARLEVLCPHGLFRSDHGSEELGR